LLRRLSWVLALHQRLLDLACRLPRRNGTTAFEGPWRGATGGQQQQSEPGAQEQ
jgi:hypothetical protein